ncbi:oligoendopeptidase F [Orenia marismortui]|uniref:Oligopeptidase F n=1 Tax=Orenia marismortui TaxID=46469 RepID=A0A4R8H2V0_9FIRM|nr:oligoendopeptidase F [Orenia marismortui]TDX52940.1 oligopeptidase F [Orenia marismortui]
MIFESNYLKKKNILSILVTLSILVVFTLSQSGEAKNTLPSREEISTEYKWDLSDIYASDQAWEDDFNQLEQNLSSIKVYKGKLSKSSTNLFEALKLQSSFDRSLSKLYNYAARKRDQDTRNNKYQVMFSKVQGLYGKFVSTVSFIEAEIIQIPTDKINQFVKEKEGLKLYQRYLEEIIRQKEHYLSPKEEQIIASTSELAQTPSNIFAMINNADLKFPTIRNEEGEEVELTKGRYYQFIKSNNRQVRKDAFDALYNTYLDLKNTFAATLNANVKKNIFYSKVRGYNSSLESSLAGNNIPVKVYDNLIKTVSDNMNSMYKYVALRKRALDVDQLHMYDLYTPIVKDVEMEFDYEEAQDIILKALEPMGEEYLQVVKRAFEERWIDVYENQGKRSGAYSASSYDAHPYILLNYGGGISDLFTLAHELGHTLHSYYSNQEQPYIYSDYSIFVAEVASTVNESLLMQYLLKNTTDKEARKYLLNYYLEQFKSTIYRQTMFAEFEKEIHQRAERGQALTAKSLSNYYHQLNQKYFGDQIIIDKKIDIEWARIPHFYYNFYVYQYATGFSAAISLSQQILDEGQPAVDRYIDFLKSGSSNDPISLLNKAGVNMTDSKAIEDALDIFSDLIDQMEKLI